MPPLKHFNRNLYLQHMSATNNSHVINFNGIKALRSTHPGVRKLKRLNAEHSAHGNKVWRSSFVLMDYLDTYSLPKHSTVLDIGCGWGLSGIFLSRKYQAKVTGIDLDGSVEPFLKLQADLNDCSVTFQRRKFESFTGIELSTFHTVIGTDICFWDEMTRPLFNLIRRAYKAGVKQILIADPGRPPFWELVNLCAEAFDAEVVTRRITAPWKTEKYILVVEN